MAFLENGSPVATKIGPIATLTTAVAGKATASEVFDLTTAYENLNTNFTTAGQYIFVTNSGTATIYLYDSSDALFQEIDVTTSSSTVTVSTAPYRWLAVASESNTVNITQVPATITSTNGNATLIKFTSPGNFAPTSGGTYNYTTGEKAWVIVAGGGGGGANGGVYVPPSPGGYGGIAFNNSAITLTGTYPISIGTGGAGGPVGTNNAQFAGQSGNSTTAFSLTATGGAGGPISTPNPAGGANGGPASIGTPVNTGVYRPTTQGKVGYGNRGAGGNPVGSPQAPAGQAGQAGAVVILKWLDT